MKYWISAYIKDSILVIKDDNTDNEEKHDIFKKVLCMILTAQKMIWVLKDGRCYNESFFHTIFEKFISTEKYGDWSEIKVNHKSRLTYISTEYLNRSNNDMILTNAASETSKLESLRAFVTNKILGISKDLAITWPSMASVADGAYSDDPVIFQGRPYNRSHHKISKYYFDLIMSDIPQVITSIDFPKINKNGTLL